MKISSKYVLRNILGQNIVEPGDIILNESGAFLWNQLREEKSKEDLIYALLAEYDISEETATEAVDIFIFKISSIPDIFE